MGDGGSLGCSRGFAGVAELKLYSLLLESSRSHKGECSQERKQHFDHCKGYRNAINNLVEAESAG